MTNLLIIFLKQDPKVLKKFTGERVNHIVPAKPGRMTNSPFLFYGPAIEKECGSNGDHLHC